VGVACATASSPQCAWTHHEEGSAWVTASGWMSVLTGVLPSRHGVRSNTYGTTQTRFPTVLRTAREHHYRTAAVATTYLLSEAQIDTGCVYAPLDFECSATFSDCLSHGPTCNLQLRYTTWGDDTRALALASAWIEENSADVIMVHFDGVDHAGHRYGWDSPEQRAALTVVDGMVGELLRRIEALESRDDWLVLATADHGGYLLSHGGTPVEDEMIPFIVATIPPSRLAPLVFPVHHYDAAPTLLKWLGLPEGDLDGRVQAI